MRAPRSTILDTEAHVSTAACGLSNSVVRVPSRIQVMSANSAFCGRCVIFSTWISARCFRAKAEIES